MTQLALTYPDDQQANLARVSGRIGPIVVEFMEAHRGQEFHLSDLTAYVQAQSPGAPPSVDRVLRDLRQRGLVDYQIVNRRQSLYREGAA